MFGAMAPNIVIGLVGLGIVVRLVKLGVVVALDIFGVVLDLLIDAHVLVAAQLRPARIERIRHNLVFVPERPNQWPALLCGDWVLCPLPDSRLWSV